MIKNVSSYFTYSNNALILASVGIVLSAVYPVFSVIMIPLLLAPFLLKPKNYIFISIFLSPIYIGFGISRFFPSIDFGSIDNIVKCGFLFGVGLLLLLSKDQQVITPFYVKITLIISCLTSISIYKAASFSDAFYFLKIYTPFILFLITVKYYKEINWGKVQTWIVFFIAANFFVSMYQLFIAQNSLFDVVRASGLAPSRNTFSMFMVIMFDFLFVCMTLRQTEKKLGIKNIAMIIAIMALVLLSFSRGAWAIFGVTVIVLLLWQKRFLIFSILLAAAAGLIVFSWGEIQQRLVFGAGTEEHRGIVSAFLLERVKEAPVFGHGFGWSQKFMIDNDLGLIQPHNDYVRFLVDVGYVGTAAILLPFILIVFRMLFLMRITRKKRIKTLALITLLSVFQICGFMLVYNTFDMFYATVSFVWFFAAITEMEHRNINRGFNNEDVFPIKT
ncbi:O-antigen ligase family protein [Paenibacillus sp. EC2-1]|uniref:O-antigen ligase family protein n=1 Tax=Paenibacillus sp. EC2-1 TaxID=3388665 RepID=UPI003BEEF2D7